MHVNYPNRVLKETTGLTTTALIGRRAAQKAKMLLKQTNWTVSEIADSRQPVRHYWPVAPA